MTADAVLEAVAMLNPRTLDRARRICEAVRLLREGVTPAEVRSVVRLRFKIGRAAAWYVVDMAEDMVIRR